MKHDESHVWLKLTNAFHSCLKNQKTTKVLKMCMHAAHMKMHIQASLISPDVSHFCHLLSLQWRQYSFVLLLFIISWRVNINRLLLSFLDMSLKYTMQFKCAFLSLYFCILKYFLIRKCLQFQLLVSNWFRKIHQMVPFSLFNCEFSTRKKWKKIQMSDVCCVL